MSDQVSNVADVSAAAAEGAVENNQEIVDNNLEASDVIEEGAEDILANAEESTESSGELTDKEAVQEKVNEQIQKWVLKGLNGEQIEVSDVNELVKRAQKGLGAELKFQEAAEIKKEAAQLLKMLHEDPIGLLEELGFNTVDLANQRIQKEMEERRKTPEQKQREQELKELEELRRKVKEQEQNVEKERYERLLAEEQNRIEEGMLSALNDAKLPIKPAYIKKMAEVMQAGLAQGIELTPKEALDFARKEVVSDLRELLDASPDEMLEDLIGGANAKRLRKRYLNASKQAKVTAATITKTPDTGAKTTEDVDSFYKPKKRNLSMKDFLKGK